MYQKGFNPPRGRENSTLQRHAKKNIQRNSPVVHILNLPEGLFDFGGFRCYLKALYNRNTQDVGFPFCCATAVFAKELWYGRTLTWVCELASLRTAGGIW